MASFDTSKTEAIVLSRRRWTNTANARGIQAGDKTLHFNKHATRWLGVWLDSKLTLKEHHDTRLKIARNAQNKLRRIVGQAGLSPENCRRVQAACVQAVALFGSELWWKRDGTHGTQTRQEDIQKLVNQEARNTTGTFRTTNQGALSMASGLRPAPAQLDNRLRRFARRLTSLPRGDQARNLVGADGTLENCLLSFLGKWDRRKKPRFLQSTL